MIIAQISDTHIALDTEDSERRIEDFKTTIRHINALDPKPDVIVHTGDIVQNGLPQEYEVCRDILMEATVPVYLMVGNKDDRANLRAVFHRAAYLNDGDGFISYAVDGYPLRLIMLDTLNPGSRKGDFCQQRIAQLSEMLDASPDKPTLVFAHHPPFLVQEGPEPLHFETPEIMEQFRHHLGKHEQVLALCCGHVHRGVSGELGAKPIFVMPCIATSLRRGDYPSQLEDRPIYHIHRYGMGELTTEAVVV